VACPNTWAANCFRDRKRGKNGVNVGGRRPCLCTPGVHTNTSKGQERQPCAVAHEYLYHHFRGLGAHASSVLLDRLISSGPRWADEDLGLFGVRDELFGRSNDPRIEAKRRCQNSESSERLTDRLYRCHAICSELFISSDQEMEDACSQEGS
jgi:hypothetical protein